MILDTSILVSFYDLDDSNHQAAIELFKKHEQSRLFLSEYIIGETITVLLYKKGLDSAKKFLEIIKETESFRIITISENDFYSILDIFKNQKHQLSFIDASLVYFSKVLNMNVLTFDKNLLKVLNPYNY
jgi:predicted nucleic acid-binding protein